MILNKSSFERGFAHASVYKTQCVDLAGDGGRSGRARATTKAFTNRPPANGGEGGKGGKGGQGKKCSKCGKMGHTQENCWAGGKKAAGTAERPVPRSEEV